MDPASLVWSVAERSSTPVTQTIDRVVSVQPSLMWRARTLIICSLHGLFLGG
ncbi:hypothetical protein SVAN01_04566 [Stagonosporopsis vannaccii]|nr:hypothetical protein SVAN01_04566 [Stagonosporopsis vannaccii]